MPDHKPGPSHNIKALIASPNQPVTVFTLSWFSYCHAVKQLLKQLGISFRLIELDTGEYRDAALNQSMRKELQQLSGSNTLPQVFIGDHAVGGYTDTQAALKSGLLKKLLAAHQISLADGPLK